MHELHSKNARYIPSLIRSAALFNLYARYHEFDFHAECKGMRYENISRLIFQVERTFEQQGYFDHKGNYARI